MSSSNDRTVPAAHAGVHIVRSDPAGKWFAEQPAEALVPAVPVSVAAAAARAVELCRRGARISLRQPGCGAFDRAATALRKRNPAR